MKGLNDYRDEAHFNASAKGFWNDLQRFDRWHSPRELFERAYVSEKLALIMSEAGEALEGHRKGDDENVAEELADVLIRVFDLTGYLGIDIEATVEKKMARNKDREHLHGKRF